MRLKMEWMTMASSSSPPGTEVDLENVLNSLLSCSDGEHSCHLHVHFHGCGMERGWLGDGYIQRTGFLPLAEANNIVMMFPQVS